MTKILPLVLSLALLSNAACAPAPTPETPLPTEESDNIAAQPDTERIHAANAAIGVSPEAYPSIDGSTSTLSIVRALWQAVHGASTGDGYPNEASKTVPAYHRLMDGEVDMIFVPSASATVLAAAKDKNVTLEFHKVAAEALIFITPPENTAKNITRDQLQAIYLHNGISNWAELGGPNRALIPIARNVDSGSQSQMDNLVLNNAPMDPAIQDNHVELTMEGMLEQVASYHTGGLSEKETDSYALGYTLYTYLQNNNAITGIGKRLKALDYEGVSPTQETIADGTYPLAEGYYAVVRSDLPQDHSARTMITWLQSEDGQNVIVSKGFIPATSAPYTS